MIVSARRAPRIHRASRSQQPGIVLGLRYERRFVKSIREALNSPSMRGFRVEHNPWFYYTYSNGESSACSPDVLLFDNDSETVYVIEVKYTWVQDAIIKLRYLYCPVVEKALGIRTSPLVVAKRLTPESPMPRLSILDFESSPLFQWTETNHLSL